MNTLPSALPALLVGGYLGAGKTTLVNHLLRHAEGRRIAVLVNDFGTLSIDADLIEGAAGEVLALAGGCVCCSYGADLVSALRAMAAREPRPDHLLIEASGVALPAVVARTASLVAEVRIEGILVLGDASTLTERVRERYTGELIRDQLRQADLVLLNHLDRLRHAAPRVEPPAALLGWLREQGVQVPAIGTSFGRIDPALAWGPLERAGAGAAFEAPRPGQRAQDLFEQETLEFDGPVDVAAVRSMLTGADSRVLRAKGVLRSGPGEAVHVQLVGQRLLIEPTGLPARNRLAIIRLKSAAPSS